MKPITFHPDAAAEITDAAEYYESRSVGLGSELLGEVEQSLERLSENPGAWQLIGRRARRKPLWRFPYNLVYAIYPDRIRVVAFAHQKRRPFYWRNRLKDSEEMGPKKP